MQQKMAELRFYIYLSQFSILFNYFIESSVTYSLTAFVITMVEMKNKNKMNQNAFLLS